MALVQESLADLKARSPNHGHVYPSTTAYYEGSLSENELGAALERLALSEELASNERACVLFGYGGRPRRVYSELRSNPGVRLLWDGAFVPWPLLPLSWIAAAHGGLVQLVERSAVAGVFRSMGELAMVELYSFDAADLEVVVRAVLAGRWRARIGPVVGSDPSYYSLGVDGDNHQSEDGMRGWVSFGGECPQSLRAAGPRVSATSSELAV